MESTKFLQAKRAEVISKVSVSCDTLTRSRKQTKTSTELLVLLMRNKHASAWYSLMLLNTTARSLLIVPGLLSVPSMVYVFPEFVTPYVKSKALRPDSISFTKGKVVVVKTSCCVDLPSNTRLNVNLASFSPSSPASSSLTFTVMELSSLNLMLVASPSRVSCSISGRTRRHT